MFLNPLTNYAEWIHPHKKYVYMFHEGSSSDKSLLGNKGANLCEMVKLKLSIPPGFIITTEACEFFREDNKDRNYDKDIVPKYLFDEYTKAIHNIEKLTGRHFGADEAHGKNLPLLLSVRSSTAISMPGVMETILNIGINDLIANLMIKVTNNRRFVFDTYRRFIQMFGTLVLGIQNSLYEDILSSTRRLRNISNDLGFSETDLESIVNEFKSITPFPSDPYTQLRMSINALFTSWFSPVVTSYRAKHDIADHYGTALVVQSMVYGNMNDRSGSGVCFTRHPCTGQKVFFGEYLPNAEGEEVLTGQRSPLSLVELGDILPHVLTELKAIECVLESHYRDMQDVEFTVENTHLFILQTRTGKRSAKAAVRVAVSLAEEEVITVRQALLRVDARGLSFFRQPTVDPEAAERSGRLAIRGQPASPGLVFGPLVFDPVAGAGVVGAVLVVDSSAPPVVGLKDCGGLVLVRGSVCSGAATEARAAGKPAVSLLGCCVLQDGTLITTEGVVMRSGSMVTLDGAKGVLYEGKAELAGPRREIDYEMVLGWADKYRHMKVMGDVDSVESAGRALVAGADGVVFRTEHMFLSPDRISAIRLAILSNSSQLRVMYLEPLLALQRQDFLQLFRLLGGRPLVVRLVDVLLPGMLADKSHDITLLAPILGVTQEQLLGQISKLHESNPLVGCRGCRLSLMYPEITTMQITALLDAAQLAVQEGIAVPTVHVLVPALCSERELDLLLPTIHSAAALALSRGSGVRYVVGCVLDCPRAVLRGDHIACKLSAEAIVAIDSGILSQLVCGIAPNCTAEFMPSYLEKHVFPSDPLSHLDRKGLAGLVSACVDRCRAQCQNRQLIVCGPHNADASSAGYWHSLGMDALTATPDLVPEVRLVAAQGYIREAAHRRAEEQRRYWESQPFLF